MSQFETYVKLNNPISDCDVVLDELMISVDYSKRGVCYLDGTLYGSGVYAYITPVHRTDCGFESIMLGNTRSCGFKVLVKELGRKSAKQIELAFDKIKTITEQIATLYDTEDYRGVAVLVKETCK